MLISRQFCAIVLFCLPSLAEQEAQSFKSSSIGLGFKKAPVSMSLVLAQAGQAVEQKPTYTMIDGYTEGKFLAEDISTDGYSTGALVCGFFTGLIGTGIMWAVTDGNDVPIEMIPDIQAKGSDYAMGFTKGYKERTKKRKRGAVMKGGLVGTAGIIFLVVANNSQ